MNPVTRKASFNSVLVLESLSAGEPATGQDLSNNVLAQYATGPTSIHFAYTPIPDLNSFLAVIATITADVRQKDVRPVLHIETHGGDDGLGLASGALLDWTTLKDNLIPLNIAMRNNLLVVAAACDGGNLINTIGPTDRAPVWGIVGPSRPMFPSDFATAFPRFYEVLLKTRNLNNAVTALRRANSHYLDPWHFYNAELIFGLGLGQYFNTKASDPVRKSLENEIVAESYARGKLTQAKEPAARRFIQASLLDDLGFFEQLKTHFLMLDLYPEEAVRFPLTVAQTLEIYTANRSALP